MGGSITVVGEPGAGSLFTVTLPINLGRIDE
jgi:signal transduction histidine kinase